MDHVTTLIRQPSPCPSTSSSSSVEIIVTTSPGPATGRTYIQYLPSNIDGSTLVPGEPLKRLPAGKNASKLRRRLLRRAARFTPEEVAAIDQRWLEKQHLKENCIALLKQFSMLREVERAKRIKIFSKSFETIRPFEIGFKGASIACKDAEIMQLSSARNTRLPSMSTSSVRSSFKTL